MPGSEDRHIFIEAIGGVSFFHYDPYAQLFSKIVRGFRQDLEDAGRFLDDGLVDTERFRKLVHGIPAESYSRYPSLSQATVEDVVQDFLSGRA